MTTFPWSNLLMLVTKEGSTKYHFNSLVYSSREMNLRPSAHQAKALPLDLQLWSFLV